MADWTPSDTIAVVSVSVAGVSVVASVAVQVWAQRRRSAEERHRQRADDLRSWRDRAVPILATIRSTATDSRVEYARYGIEPGDSQSEHYEWVAAASDVVLAGLAELAAGHPDQVVRHLAAASNSSWSIFTTSFSGLVALVREGPHAGPLLELLDVNDVATAVKSNAEVAVADVDRLIERIHEQVDDHTPRLRSPQQMFSAR